MAGAAGFGRLGGIGGPLLGGHLVGSGTALDNVFYLFAGLAVLGLVLTPLAPVARRSRDLRTTPLEPSEVAPVPAEERRR